MYNGKQTFLSLSFENENKPIMLKYCSKQVNVAHHPHTTLSHLIKNSANYILPFTIVCRESLTLNAY